MTYPIEQTQIGPQYIIPGTERASQADCLKRRAEMTLTARRASSGQKFDMPESGLWGDAMNQMELF